MRYANVVSLGVAVVAVACAGVEEPVEYADAVTADPDHYSVEFENDAARIIRIKYEPGETSVMHQHPPNCALYIRDEPASTMESPDGEITETESVESGTVRCSEGTVHLPTNTGNSVLELLLVEFQEGATAGAGLTLDAPDAVTADPSHYSVEFENDVVRVLRISYQPGDATVMHSHAANCVVWLKGQPENFGRLMCSDSQEHKPDGASDMATELLAVEFKARTSLH